MFLLFVYYYGRHVSNINTDTCTNLYRCMHDREFIIYHGNSLLFIQNMVAEPSQAERFILVYHVYWNDKLLETS